MNNRQIQFTTTIALIFLGVLLCISISAQSERYTQPFRLNGNISLGGFVYSADGLTARQPSEGYSLSTQMNIDLYGVSIPLYASINEQGSRFENPFNRFGISPQYKWAKLHLGWRNMQFSQFTMQGVSFLGGGMELTPRKWRISVMYGRFQEATNGTNRNYIGPRFERKGWAAKIGYGTALNFFELNIFKAKDDLSTLNIADSTRTEAHENLCIGATTQFHIVPKYLKAGFEIGLSGFTEDLRSDTLPEEAQRYIEGIAWAYEPNISSHFNYAIESFTTLSIGPIEISGKYRRIMPEYQTLGVNYLLNDIEAITIAPRYRSKNGKISIALSMGKQRNNLDGWRANQNERWIGSGQLDYNPSINFGFHLQYSNYTFTQQLVRDTLKSDSLVLNQVNQNIVLTPRWLHRGTDFNHVLLFNYNFQQLNDQSLNEFSQADNKMHLINVNYNLSEKSKDIRYILGANYFKFSSSLYLIERIGFNLGYQRSFINRKIRFKVNTGYQKSIQSSDYNYYIGINGSWSITKKITLNLQSRIRSGSRNEVQQSEIRSEVTVRKQF